MSPGGSWSTGLQACGGEGKGYYRHDNRDDHPRGSQGDQYVSGGVHALGRRWEHLSVPADTQSRLWRRNPRHEHSAHVACSGVTLAVVTTEEEEGTHSQRSAKTPGSAASRAPERKRISKLSGKEPEEPVHREVVGTSRRITEGIITSACAMTMETAKPTVRA